MNGQNKGKEDQVWNLNIEGNDTFSDVVIKDQIATSAFSFWEKLKFWDRKGHKLNEIALKKDVIRIQNFYNRRGFYDVSVNYRVNDGKKSWKKNITFVVNENAAIRIADISFHFDDNGKFRSMIMKDPDFEKARRKSEFQKGERYEKIKNAEVTGAYEQVLKNMGFAYVSVKVNAKIDTARLAANLVMDCSLGPRTYIDSISVEGDSTVTDAYLIRESGLKIGQLYNLDDIQSAQSEIFNHHLFKFATISIPDQPKDSTLDLDMRVREKKLRTVKVSAGFGTEEYLRGKVSWTYRNAFNRAHKFTTTARASFIEQTLNLDYLFPYVFNTKSSVVLSPFAQHLLEPSYELFRLGSTNSFIYRYSKNLTGSFAYQYTRNAELSQQLQESLPDTTLNYNLSSLQLSAYFNQGFGQRGQEGWVVQPYAEVSGFFKTATYNFQKLSLDIRRYTRLTPSTMLATRLQGGKLFSVKKDSLPNNVRYYLGGTNSVRGWGRQQLGPKRVVMDSVRDKNGNVIADSTRFSRYIPVGGRTYFAFNVEIRQNINDLIKNFGINAFLDGGQVWSKGLNTDKRPIQYSIGGGLSYNSPIGPVRVDVGYKLNPFDADLNRYQGKDYGSAWDHIGIHVSVGQAF